MTAILCSNEFPSFLPLDSHLLVIFHKVNHVGNLVFVVLLLEFFWTRHVIALFHPFDFIIIFFQILVNFLLLSLEVHSEYRISLSLTWSSLEVLLWHIILFFTKVFDLFRTVMFKLIRSRLRHLQVWKEVDIFWNIFPNLLLFRKIVVYIFQTFANFHLRFMRTIWRANV